MSWNARRASIVLLALIVAVSAVWLDQGHAQVKGIKKEVPPPGGPGRPGGTDKGANPDGFLNNGGIRLVKDEKGRGKQIEAILDFIDDGDQWLTVVERLHRLLKIEEDVFVRLKRKNDEGQDVYVWVSAKQEADRLIGTLPPDGLDIYKNTYGGEAANLLKKAKKDGDAGLLADIMKLYPHTDAGTEATKLLGDYKFDRGDYNDALLCYSKLINRQGEEKVPVTLLLKAAWAAHLAPPPSSGQNTITTSNVLAEKELWKMLRGRTREVQLGEQTLTVDELEDHVAKLDRSRFEQNALDATVYRATPSRSNQLIGGPAFMTRRWGADMLYEKEQAGAAAERIRLAKAAIESTHQPLIPAFVPITLTLRKGETITPLVIYKDYHGVSARDLRDGRKLLWASPSNWSLQRMLTGGTQKQSAINSWLSFYNTQIPQLLFENSTVNTLSSDGQYVYFVEDLAVPPPPQPNFNNMGFNPGMPADNNDKDTQDAIGHSRLYALDLMRTGALTWVAGDAEKGPFSESYFLGSPLPLAGKLYLLTEKQQEIRLLCVDPTKIDPVTHEPKVLSIQTLGMTQEKMQGDVFRRTTAAHLAYGEGILVCPTNAGAIFGVNLLENSLVWAYPYRDKNDVPEQPNMGMGRFRQPAPAGFQWGPDGQLHPILTQQRDQWKGSAPVIADGKVVFTAPDARSIHCVNLRDGSPVWRRPKLGDDLYLGNVHNGKVLIVGKKNVRGLSLATGETLWTLEAGTPSGQGIGSDNVYYLPLKDGGKEKEPRILGIDMDTGKVASQSKSRPRRKIGDKIEWETPGNLLFHEGNVISVTTDEIVVYQQLKNKIAEMDLALAKNPNDPIGLTERGDLRLDKGDLAGAIDDLSTALQNNPDKPTRYRAREKLYETLTAYITDHFNDAERNLKEYEGLCKLDIDADATAAERAKAETEQRRRRATYLWLVGKGREEQGRLVEAFEKYQEFGAEAGKQSELVPAVDDPQVKAAPDVWSRGRILAMMNNAKPENREPLEKLIAEKWNKIRATNDLNELRAFVRMFGAASNAGKEARLELVERLMEQKESGDEHPLVEAELELNQFRTGRHSPELAARATESLARLYTRKGLLEDAAYCYRKLGKEYGKIVLREGKTGQQIYDDDAATDKRLLPYLDDPLPLGSVHRFGSKKEAVDSAMPGGGSLFQFEHSGENLPFFRHHIVGLNFGNHNFTLLDRSLEDGNRQPRTVWTTKLSDTSFQTLTNAVLGQQVNPFNPGVPINPNGNPNSRFPYSTVGHLIVLPVGHRVFGIDPVNHHVLWEKDLSEGAGPVKSNPSGRGPVWHPQQIVVDPRDGSVLIPYSDNWAQRLGQVSPFEGQTICVQTADRLNALDPLTGRVLWSRQDVGSRNYLFADEDYVFVVELDDKNNATSSRVFRAVDGISVKAPDFSALFGKRLQVFGRYLLLSETNATNSVVLRLYDVASGQDVWKETYPARSIVARSEDASLTGVVEPEGKVHVIDLKARKEVLSGELWEPSESLKGVQRFHLLADRTNFYFVPSTGNELNAAMQMGQMGGFVQPSNVMTQFGMRTVPVHGELQAFERGTKERWHLSIKNQYVILDQFEDLPLLFLTSRMQEIQNMPGMVRGGMQVVTATSILKKGARIVFDEKLPANTTNFFGVRVDPRANTIELLSQRMKITHFPLPEKDKNAKPAAEKPAPKSTPTPTPPQKAIGLRINRPAFDRAQIREIAPPAR
jgi:outer membrane protein assembly factor BamB/tetratricopeptide (TPR) repeat protein